MHFCTALYSLLAFTLTCNAQQIGTFNPEVHPSLTTQKCTKKGGCVTQNTKIVLDANWRWLHDTSGYTNCYSGNNWDPTLCPDPVTCAENCALDGANYAGTYGVNANGPNLTLLLFPSGSIGSRVYLLSDDTHYEVINLKNQEFTFDVDVSGLPCGANGAVYFTNMMADGGQGAYPNNKAGAAYGTGYCDSQCPRDIKFINGEANLLNWNTSTTTGRYGTCCAEMDIWEANSVSTAYTAHTCNVLGQTRCDGQSSSDCGDSGFCDHAGCDFNPYRMGNHSFYGYGGTLATNAPNTMRVVTQFLTKGNTATGNLVQIRRFYIQHGKVIANSVSDIKGISGNSLTSAYCSAEKKTFGETDYFTRNGGMTSMSEALSVGMVLTLSVWVDYAEHMLWLDSDYPTSAPVKQPGVARGTCARSSGNPPDVQSQYPTAQVKFSNIKWGDIGTTFGPPYP